MQSKNKSKCIQKLVKNRSNTEQNVFKKSKNVFKNKKKCILKSQNNMYSKTSQIVTKNYAGKMYSNTIKNVFKYNQKCTQIQSKVYSKCSQEKPASSLKVSLIN